MGLFDKLFGRKKQPAPSTSELARERLTLMLVHDRLKLTPDLLDRIKGELLAVISKYVEIDESGVDVELTHTEHSDKLVARMPVRRQRLHFERDVLEPGMGNPIVAAAALAKIHQSPAEAASAAPAQEAEAVPAVSAPATQETPASADSAAPEAAAATVSEAPAASAEKGAQQAEVAAAAVETPAAEPAAEATATQTMAGAAQTAPAETEAAAAQETPASPAEVNASPAGEGTSAASASEGTVPVEAPAPAATPTKG